MMLFFKPRVPFAILAISRFKAGFIILLASFANGCSIGVVDDSAPDRAVDIHSIPDAVPRIEPRSRSGNPRSYVVMGKRYYTLKSSEGYVERGIASWYGKKFHGRKTSNGDTYNMYAMTAAHRSLPLPTFIQVTNLRNGRHIIVKVNDRGPFHHNRIVDLSYVAAAKLGIIRSGTGLVELRAINPHTYNASRSGVPLRSASKGNTGLYLQVGAFAIRHNAEQMVRRLKQIAVNLVEIRSSHSRQKKIYRVRIGPLNSIKIADQVAKTLIHSGIQNHRVVIE